MQEKFFSGLLSLIFCAVTFLFFTLYTVKEPILFNCDKGKYSFYLKKSSSNCEIVRVLASDAPICKSNLFCVIGESLHFDAENYNEEGLAYCESKIREYGAQLVFCESGAWGENLYYYTAKIKNYVIISGKRVNIHLAKGENSVAIGSPLIFGSY